MSDFIELKRLAMEATPGPWEIQVSHYPESGDMIVTTDPNGWELLEIREDCPEHEANAEFIAAANPKTILALIAENEKLRGALELLKNPLSILSISTKCMACGEYHEGLGNLPCPKMRPMSSLDAEQGNG